MILTQDEPCYEARTNCLKSVLSILNILMELTSQGPKDNGLQSIFLRSLYRSNRLMQRIVAKIGIESLFFDFDSFNQSMPETLAHLKGIDGEELRIEFEGLLINWEKMSMLERR